MNFVSTDTLGAAVGLGALPRDAGLIGALLDDQANLTAVERFAQLHEHAREPLQARYYSALERFRDLPATTVAGIAMHLRLHFVEQCHKPWNFQATLTMELTPEQVEEIDSDDLVIFQLAQTAMRLAEAGRA